LNAIVKRALAKLSQILTVMSIAKKLMRVLGILDRAEGCRWMLTSAGRLVGKVGRRLPVSHETE
jgi:hypothetical protein